MTNEPFDLEKWLESKKKGFGGKVSRTDFIAKIKELNELAEEYKKEKQALETQLKTAQTENEKAIIKGVEKLLTDTISPLRAEIAQLKQVPKTSKPTSTELPTDYEEVKRINKDLYAILAGVKENLPKDK